MQCIRYSLNGYDTAVPECETAISAEEAAADEEEEDAVCRVLVN